MSEIHGSLDVRVGGVIVQEPTIGMDASDLHPLLFQKVEANLNILELVDSYHGIGFVLRQGTVSCGY